jgi:hypothetical protein
MTGIASNTPDFSAAPSDVTQRFVRWARKRDVSRRKRDDFALFPGKTNL